MIAGLRIEHEQSITKSKEQRAMKRESEDGSAKNQELRIKEQEAKIKIKEKKENKEQRTKWVQVIKEQRRKNRERNQKAKNRLSVSRDLGTQKKEQSKEQRTDYQSHVI